jgi:ribonuclease VapC
MTQIDVVLDASAVLAAVLDEPGGDEVAAVVRYATVPAPNWAEILDVAEHRHGGQPAVIVAGLKGLGLLVEPVDEDDAETAARLAGTNRGLSLGDRFCLAVAERLELPVYTTDRAWAKATTAAEVVMVR